MNVKGSVCSERSVIGRGVVSVLRVFYWRGFICAGGLVCSGGQFLLGQLVCAGGGSVCAGPAVCARGGNSVPGS